MPDGDVLGCKLLRRWLRPGRLYADSASTQDVAAAASSALAGSLREAGGVPGLGDMAGVVERVASGQLPHLDALNELRTIERDAQMHRHTRVAVRAVEQLLVELVRGATVPSDPIQAVAERACQALVTHFLFGPLTPRLVGEPFAVSAKAGERERACADALQPDIASMARKLAAEPTANHLRRPRSSTALRRSTADLLREPITVLGSQP